MNEKESLFRKKSIDHISSQEQLTDYLRVTTPGIWVILLIVMVLLGSLVAWASIGRLETTADVKVVVKGHNAQIISNGDAELSAGMQIHVSEQDSRIAAADKDEYGRSVGVAEVDLPDGVYDGKVVTEETRPMDFLLKAR